MSGSQSPIPTSKPLSTPPRPSATPLLSGAAERTPVPPAEHASVVDDVEIVEVAPAPPTTKSSPPPPPSRRPIEIVEAAPARPIARATFASIFTLDAFRPTDPLAIAKMTPAVSARRARLQNYVKVVVAGCAALCLVALVRVATAAPPEIADGSHGIAVTKVVRKAVATKTLALDEEVRADALRATAWARRGGPRHR